MATIRVGVCVDLQAPGTPAGVRRLAGSDILVFPEMVDSGYAALAAGARPHLPGDELSRTFADWSNTLAPYCVAGSIVYRDPSGASTNTSLVFHRGRLIHRYDKIHLFRPAGDHRYFAPGKTLCTFTARVRRARVRCGVVICYDLRFPELIRALAVRGLDLLFVPARWPAVRDDHWRTLLKARAIENQIFVVGCNARGNEGGWSYVFDPLGRMVFSSRGKAERRVHSVPLDLRVIAESQRMHRNLDEAVVLRSSRAPVRVTARRAPERRSR
jgi:predicted amidohydrolase